MPAPRTSFEGTANDSGKLVIVNSPQGLPFLDSAEPAPQTVIARPDNERITAQAGLPWLPTNAAADNLGAGTPKNARGGAGRVSTTEGGRAQGHTGDENA